MFALDEYKELTNNSIAKLDAKFLSFYGLTALIFLAVFVGQYFYGSFAEIIYYYLAVSMFFSAFFISKLITVIFEFFYKNNHASLLFLTSLPRLSLFLLAFVCVPSTTLGMTIYFAFNEFVWDKFK